MSGEEKKKEENTWGNETKIEEEGGETKMRDILFQSLSLSARVSIHHQLPPI